MIHEETRLHDVYCFFFVKNTAEENVPHVENRQIFFVGEYFFLEAAC